MPDIDFDELDRAVHDLMRQSGQLPTTPDKPSEAPAATPSKDSTPSSTQAASPQQTTPAVTSARPEEGNGTQDTSTPRAQDDNTSTDSAQQVDSPDTATPAKQSPVAAPQDNTNSTDEAVQADDAAATDATSDTDAGNTPVRRRGLTIMPLSQQVDGAEPAGESYESTEPEPAVDRARALSESVVASEREPASIPAEPEQTDVVDDAESTQANSVDTAPPVQTTADDAPSQPQPTAIVTVDPDDIITPASDDDDEDDDAYTDRAQFFGRSAARPFVAPPAREATPVDDVASVAHSDTPAPAAETDNVTSSISSDNVASEGTSAAATEEEMPATIEQVESETPTMPYQFAGEDAEGDDDDDDEALVRHLNEVNQVQDDDTEPAQASVVDDLDDGFAPQPLIIPPPTEKTDDTPLSSAETAVQPTDDAYTANDVPVAAPQDEPDNTTSVSDTDDANDDQLLYAPATSADTDISGVPNSSDIPDNEIVQSLGQQHEETAWPELQYDEPDNIPGVQASDVDHATPAWPEVATDSTSVADDSQTAAQVADADMLSEHVSFGDEGMPWQDELAAPSTQSHVDDVAPAELLTAERAIPDTAVANDNPSSQPEETSTEDAMPEAHIDRPLPLLSTYNEHRATPEPHFDISPLSDSQEEANAIDVTDAAQNTNDIAQSTTDMQLPDTPDDQAEQLYAPTTPLFAPADDVVAKAQQIIAARPETSTNDAPTPPQEEEDTPKNAPDVVPITLSQSVDQQTEPSVADLPAMHTADETASAEQNDDQAAAPSIQRPRGRFMDIVGGAAPVAAAAQAARPRVRRQGAVVEPLTSSAPVVGMDIRPAPGHEVAQHHAEAANDRAGGEAKASDGTAPDETPSAGTLDLQPGDEKPLSYTPFLPDAETKVDKRPLGGADTLVGDVPTLADTTPMGMYHDEPGAFGIAPADANEPSIPQHLFAPHDEHASAEQFIDALTDTSENAPSLYPTDDHYPLPEQDTPEAATADDKPMYQLEDHYGADRSLYPDEPADSHEASADGAGPQFAEDEIDLSLPVPGPGEPDIDYYGEAERVEAEPMTTATEWDDEPDTSDQAHVNTIEEAAATTQNGDTALALHQALQEENEGNVVAPIYSAEEFTRAPKKSRRRPEQAAGWIWLLWIVMLLALGAGLGAVYYTLFG